MINPFDDDTLVPVSCPEPRTQEERDLRFLAHKFGSFAFEESGTRTQLLYGQRVFGANGRDTLHDMDQRDREGGKKYLVPKWLVILAGSLRGYRSKASKEGYSRGVRYGKNLLQRLSDGDLTVSEFNQDEGAIRYDL